MKIASTICLVMALWLGLLFGGQPEAWSWGPSFLAMTVAVMLSLPGRCRGGEGSQSKLLWGTILAATGWISWRCVTSPVLDFARADFMLILAAFSVAWLAADLRGDGVRIRIVYLGLLVGVVANVVMAVLQIGDPDFMWPYAFRPAVKYPSGFFSHYNYFVGFMAGASLLLLGRALLGSDPLWQRLLHGCGFLSGVLMIPMSGSRGGLAALGFGLMVMLVMVWLILWRRKSKWLPAILIACPLVLIGSGLLGWNLMMGKLQKERQVEAGVTKLVDNQARLEWIDLALRVAGNHPMTGGGSRAYSWERNAEWDFDEFGSSRENEPFVHNEILQLCTDYGIIGGVLVTAAIAVLVGSLLGGIILGHKEKERAECNDAQLAGCSAAAAALLFQGNFSYIFHMLPSSLLIGLVFGLVIGARRGAGSPAAGKSWIGYLAGAVMVALLGFLGWNASRAFRAVWPVVYTHRSLTKSDPEAAVSRLRTAASVWNGFRLHEEMGKAARLASSREGLAKGEVDGWNAIAADAYRRAFEFHPHNAELAVNLAMTCELIGQDDEAERYFLEVIELQGGLEPMFRGRFFLARHLYYVWSRKWKEERRAEEALGQFMRARQLLEESKNDHPRAPVDRQEFEKALDETIKFLAEAGVIPTAGLEMQTREP